MGTRVIDGKTVAADLRGKVMDECELDSGAEWGTPDTGHFEVPTEGYGTRIARNDARGSGGMFVVYI